VLFPFEVEDETYHAFEKNLGGRWVQIGSVREVGVWKWEPAATATAAAR